VFATRATTTSGIAVDATPFAITTATGQQSAPTLVYLTDSNHTFAVAWSDGRSGTGDDIYGALIVEGTRAVTSEHVISANAEPELRPAFSRGKVKKSSTIIEVLVGYQRFSPTSQTQRMVMRKITYQP
jgi:hypothetical protein